MEPISSWLSLTLGVFSSGIGYYASIFGGGAAVFIPLLVAFGVPVLVAIGTIRVAAIIQEFVASLAYLQHDNAPWKRVFSLAVSAGAGAVLGAFFVLHVPNNILLILVALFSLLIFLALLLFSIVPRRPFKKMPQSFAWLCLFLFFLGIYGGFFGGAFGMIVTFWLRRSTSWTDGVTHLSARVIGFVMSLCAGVVFIAYGLVSAEIFFPIVLGLTIGSWVSIRMHLEEKRRWIEWGLTTITTLASAKILFSL